MAALAHFVRGRNELVSFGRAVRVVARRAFARFQRGMHMRLVQLLFELLMAVPAKVFLLPDEEMPVAAAVRRVAIRTDALLERAVNIGFFEQVPYVVVAAQAQGLDILFHQSLVAADMHVVARAAFALLEREMDELLGHLLFQFGVTLEAEIGRRGFDRGMRRASSRKHHHQKKAQSTERGTESLRCLMPDV